MMSEHKERAREYAHKIAADPKKERKWLSSPIPNSYGDRQYEVTVEVLEGSPPRGIMISTPHRTKLVFWDGTTKTFVTLGKGGILR